MNEDEHVPVVVWVLLGTLMAPLALMPGLAFVMAILATMFANPMLSGFVSATVASAFILGIVRSINRRDDPRHNRRRAIIQRQTNVRLRTGSNLFMITLAFGFVVLFDVRSTRAEPGENATSESVQPRFVREWGREGTEPGEFHFPIGIAINGADEVFVSDFYNGRVQKFSTEGKLLAVIPVLPNPGGIALNKSGDIFLAHFAEKKRAERTADGISVYSPTGTLLRQWGRTGNNDGEFDCPGGLAIASNGTLYVADQTNRRVQRFDEQGKFLGKWGEYGMKEGQFGGNVSILSRVGGPQFVAFDRQGNLYTTEGSVGRVQKFTADGRFLAAWGDNQDKPGSFGGVFTGFKDRKATLQGPVAIIVDRDDRIWVSAVSGRIQQFTSDGKFLRGFGSQGDQPGQFFAPHGLAFDSRGDLYVVDAFNHRIQRFAVR